MSEPLFDIVFRGDIVIGHNIQDVKQRLSQLFKIDASKVDALFAGGAVPLKRKVDQATADKYKGVLAKAGAQVQIRPAEDGQSAKPQPKPRPVRPTSQIGAGEQESPTKKLTLKERLAQQAAEEAKAEKTQAKKAKPETVAATTTSGNEIEYQPNSVGLTLAPVGSILGAGTQSEVKPVQVDVSAISLKPMEGDLLEANEKKPDPQPTVQAGNYAVAEVGADLLKAEERPPVTEVTIEFTDFDIAEVGADLLEAAHKLALPEVEINTDDFSLAPVGSDMGEKKKDPPPPPPDTSSLSLSN